MTETKWNATAGRRYVNDIHQMVQHAIHDLVLRNLDGGELAVGLNLNESEQEIFDIRVKMILARIWR